MSRYRILILVCSLGTVALAIWLGGNLRGERPNAEWRELTAGIWRTTSMPYGYALVAEKRALLIDCPLGFDGLKAATRVDGVDAVLLTHHHWDTCLRAGEYLKVKVPVRAAKSAADWLTPAGVTKFWAESIPLRNSRTAYFVAPVGIEGIDCSLVDGEKIDWKGWNLQAVATPGHSRDHLTFMASRANSGPLAFCGDLLAAPGKLWTPYTTDWDHWTDAGLGPQVTSLRSLAARKPKALYPAHGEPITQNAPDALEQTAKNAEEMAFLKSFERFSKQRLGNPPSYPFLVPREQVASGGDKPWAKVSDHVYITGNTYVLLSKDDRAYAVFDPWGKRSVDQIAKLKKDLNLGTLELVMFSHAHYDHYDGVYDLPGYTKEGPEPQFKVWALDRVALPIADPLGIRAPFLDARPVRFDKRFQDGESAEWREYRFRFHHLPGQSEFTMGVETAIDGKRCWFTADNFFHQDQFSGTGGWMGLNRSWPMPYAQSAKKVLDAAPDWVLAEHGGPYVFNAEDYRRRVEWGEESAKAADALAVTGRHRHDWDPYRVQALPLLQKARPGDEVTFRIIATASGDRPEKFAIQCPGRSLFPDQSWTLTANPGQPKTVEVKVTLANSAPKGRHVFPLHIAEAHGIAALDVFLAMDVE